MPAHSFRSTVVAAVAIVAVLAISALPAEAQLFRRHNDGSVSIDPLLCLSDYQVRQAIGQQGFSNIFLNAPIENHVQARGTKGSSVYLIDFDRCDGSIVSAQKLRSAK